MRCMKEIMTPLSLLITALAAWLNERNNETIDFLREEVETYKAIVGDGRLPLTDEQPEAPDESADMTQADLSGTPGVLVR